MLVGLFACSGGEAEKPAAAPTPVATTPAAAASAAPKGLVVTMGAVGGIKPDTAPTKVALMTALGEGYEVRPSQSGLVKGSMQVLKDGKVLLEVVPTTAGTAISKVIVLDVSVSFPWNTKVGDRIGAHKHWSRMACETGKDVFAGKAVCKAYADGRMSYVVDGVTGELPPKETVGDLLISAMVWTPGAGKGGQAGKGG